MPLGVTQASFLSLSWRRDDTNSRKTFRHLGPHLGPHLAGCSGAVEGLVFAKGGNELQENGEGLVFTKGGNELQEKGEGGGGDGGSGGVMDARDKGDAVAVVASVAVALFVARQGDGSRRGEGGVSKGNDGPRPADEMSIKSRGSKGSYPSNDSAGLLSPMSNVGFSLRFDAPF